MNVEDTIRYDDDELEESTRTWFFLMLLYLFVDYARPQDVLPIGAIRPGMISNILLGFMVLKSGEFGFYFSLRQIRAIFFLTALIAVFVPFARNNYYAWLVLKTMLLYIPFILSTVSCINTLGRLKILIDTLVLIMFWIALFAITHNGKGPGNYFEDQNDLSLFVNMFLPFCYYLFFHENSRRKKLLYLSVFIAGLAAVVVSFSRGGFIGLLGVGGVIWLNSKKKLKSMLIIGFVASMVFIYAGDKYIQEMSTVTNLDESTASIRIESWKSALNMFIHNPWGVGGYNFQILFPEYQTDFFHREMWGRVAHSLWFTLIPELGTGGILIYFFILFWNMKDIFFLKQFSESEDPEMQYLHALSLSFLASLAGYFASGTFLSVLYYAHYWYMTAIIVATKLIAMELMPEDEREKLDTYA